MEWKINLLFHACLSTWLGVRWMYLDICWVKTHNQTSTSTIYLKPYDNDNPAGGCMTKHAQLSWTVSTYGCPKPGFPLARYVGRYVGRGLQVCVWARRRVKVWQPATTQEETLPTFTAAKTLLFWTAHIWIYNFTTQREKDPEEQGAVWHPVGLQVEQLWKMYSAKYEYVRSLRSFASQLTVGTMFSSTVTQINTFSRVCRACRSAAARCLFPVVVHVCRVQAFVQWLDS